MKGIKMPKIFFSWKNGNKQKQQVRSADFSYKEIRDQLSQEVLYKCECGREGFSNYFCPPKKFTWDNIQISKTGNIAIKGYCRKCGGSNIIPLARICFCGKEMDNPSNFFCSEECKNRHFAILE